jgi:hypothetical protein
MLDHHTVNVELDSPPHKLMFLNPMLSGIYAFLPQPDMLTTHREAVTADLRGTCSVRKQARPTGETSSTYPARSLQTERNAERRSQLSSGQLKPLAKKLGVEEVALLH